jgi:hypothetical protein
MFMQNEAIEWGSRSTGAVPRTRLHCGSLLVEMIQGENEVTVASKRLSEAESANYSGDDTAVSWTDWTVCTGARGVEILPQLPDRPVLARGDSGFDLPPGETTRVFLRIPLTLVVKSTGQNVDTLAELPTGSLPPIVFGELEEAESCYLLPTAPSRSVFDDPGRNEVLAPIQIRNESTEVLTVTQICLRLAHLSIYSSGKDLWTSETLVRYQGGANRSRISVKSGAPAEARNARLIAGPRLPGPATLIGRTFRSFLDWTQGAATRCF